MLRAATMCCAGRNEILKDAVFRLGTRGKPHSWSLAVWKDRRPAIAARTMRRSTAAFCRIRNKNMQENHGVATRLQEDVASSRNYSRSTSLEGFNVSEHDTTAVLSPISGQSEETETSSQTAPALAGGQAKAATEKKRSGRQQERGERNGRR